MVKTVIFSVFLFCFINGISAQINTFFHKKESDNELDTSFFQKNEKTENEGTKKVFFPKKIFRKISDLFKNKNEQDSVPTNPNLFSYDKPDVNPFFIFTEEQERIYLDSLKMALIRKRKDVLMKRAAMSLPLDTLQITSYFGYRKDPFTGEKKFHNGIDFRAKNNFVYPILPGIVIQAGYRGGYGFCIEVQHGDMTTLYAHLSYILVKDKQTVPAGEPIGISGTTGRSTGEHLHFSVTQNGKFINPSIVLEYILGELADKNLSKKQIQKEKKMYEQDLEKEKEMLQKFQEMEKTEDSPKNTVSSIIWGGEHSQKGIVLRTNGKLNNDTLYNSVKTKDNGVRILPNVSKTQDHKHNDKLMDGSVIRRKVVIKESDGMRIIFVNGNDGLNLPKRKDDTFHSTK